MALSVGFYGGLHGEQFDAIYRDSPRIYEAGGVASCLRRDRPALLMASYDLIVDAERLDCNVPETAPEGAVRP